MMFEIIAITKPYILAMAMWLMVATPGNSTFTPEGVASHRRDFDHLLNLATIFYEYETPEHSVFRMAAQGWKETGWDPKAQGPLITRKDGSQVRGCGLMGTIAAYSGVDCDPYALSECKVTDTCTEKDKRPSPRYSCRTLKHPANAVDASVRIYSCSIQTSKETGEDPLCHYACGYVCYPQGRRYVKRANEIEKYLRDVYWYIDTYHATPGPELFRLGGKRP